MSTITGTRNSDTLVGTSDNDTINGLSGQDLLVGGEGADQIDGGEGNDTIFGDVQDGSGVSGDDTIFGGTGQDTIFGQGGEDVISGDDGSDFIDGGAGADTLLGGQGSDTISGGLGDDSIDGGSDDDRLFGNEGDDTLTGGAGNTLLNGGTGSDIFSFTGAGNHTVVGGEDADGNDFDVFDLRGFDVNIVETGTESGRVEFLDSSGNITRRLEYSEIERVVICFTPGTMVATMGGEVAVENLRVGDRVFTRDNGIQTLAWVGKRKLSGQELAGQPELNPIVIKAGALGNDVPERDMIVSPNHRMLVSSTLSDYLFGEREVLVAAKYLTGLDGVSQVAPSAVEYIHLMFEHHEIILADGAWTESFQPGDHSLSGIKGEQRAEIITLFPELETHAGRESYGAARLSLKKHEAAYLSKRLAS
jgi:hypothetical protein